MFLNLVGSQEDGAALDSGELPIVILGEGVTGINRDHIAELKPKKVPPPRSALPAVRPTANPGSALGRWLVALWQDLRRRFP
jgi:hypothetical protein